MDGSTKTEGLPTFRSSFSRELNERDDQFIYTESIGNATSRPIGTIYANTSYAHVHKNALFVSVDAFHFKGVNSYDKEKGTGGTGVVSCTVVGEHLAWFENVLSEATNDSTIKHIFVQAHVPILQPVRKINSSGQFLDDATRSEFWKVMQKYGVDIYFGGEVHSVTATKDPESNLLQVISRANRLDNFLKVHVSNDSLEISAFNEEGANDWRWNANYTKYGKIIIDKSGTDTSFQSSGALKFLEVGSSPLIQFNFDVADAYILRDRQIVGMKYDQFTDSFIGESVTIRNETTTLGLKNHGVFGRKLEFCILLLFTHIITNYDQSISLHSPHSPI